MASNGNPFEEGKAAALAGRTWKQCPYRITQREFTRWNCGYQAGLGEKGKAEKAQPDKPAQEVQGTLLCAGR